MKTMKKFAALMMLLCALMLCTIPALAANESGSDSDVTETVNVTAGSNDNDVTSAKAMGSGVMIGIACLGGALAMGIAVGKSSEAMARQPEATSQIRTTMMMGLVFIETVIIFFLPYKPVKSFMDSRKAHYEKMDEDAKAVLAEAEKTKAGYEAQLKSADEEIARRQREANEALQHAVDERRAQAEQQAGEIVRKAREDAAREHERVMEQAKGEISELMSAAAEKLVLSSTSDAYDKFLDTAEERKDNG